MKSFILAVFIVLAGLVPVASACSLIVDPLSRFDEKEFIFIGDVKGYTEAIAPEGPGTGGFTAPGLIVEVGQAVFLPETASSFEVFPIELFADCSLGGTDRKTLEKNFPLGTQIRVVAKRAELFAASGDKGVIRLERRPARWSMITKNTDETGKSVTSSASVFDYRAFGKDPRRSGWMSDLPLFEIRKDFLRLKNAASQAERNAILDRLLGIPPEWNIDLMLTLKSYASSEAEADRLYELNLKTYLPEVYDQYIGVKNARAELAKMGYKKEDIEEAMGKGMGQGAGFTAEEIVKGALKYLPPIKKN